MDCDCGATKGKFAVKEYLMLAIGYAVVVLDIGVIIWAFWRNHGL